MDTWHSRLATALDARGMKQSMLAQFVGVKPASVNDWISGKTKMFGGSNLIKTCEFLKINESWLLYGKLPSGLENVRAMQEGPAYVISNADPAMAIGDIKRIGVVGTAQLGDDGFWAELEYPAGHGDGYVEHSTRDMNAYALRCKGDSMKPRIKHGEFVIIEPGHAPIPGDEVMVKCNQGRVMVKELLYIRDGIVYLGSVNEAHGKITIPMHDVESIHYVAAIVKSSYWKPE